MAFAFWGEGGAHTKFCDWLGLSERASEQRKQGEHWRFVISLHCMVGLDVAWGTKWMMSIKCCTHLVAHVYMSVDDG